MTATWELEQLPIADSEGEPLSALRISCKFPAPEQQRLELAGMISGCQRWLKAHRTAPLRRELFVQMTQLPRPGGAAPLSRNASRWMPGIAMGVWPDREPPRSMRKEDFTHRPPNTPFPRLSDEARRILARSEEVKLEVESELSGSGALLTVIAPEGWAETDGRHISAKLEERIADEVCRTYPLFIPLFDAHTLTHLSRDERNQYLRGIELYIREDSQDRSVLLLSRTPFEETLAMLESTVETTAPA
ncbi:hypothetical protein [Silvibacterium dinghuense]|uniref:Uncharacterized protein n=1 Tax=Silvibacterium dinghuense TaxID=1560006 RepID=A0A4V1NVX4_9BACT|nr:hypothetical protein [Silvibacterium dinghuense]RXS97432.1 hypothetical protein ESZ00_05920 [Silvibacterium dinghuense]GGG98983.1 hypothetical protein GCM10011586_13070 [Silvibacterium dinghuense]